MAGVNSTGYIYQNAVLSGLLLPADSILPVFNAGRKKHQQITEKEQKGSGMRNSMILSLFVRVLGLGLLFLVFNIVFRTTGTVLFPKNRGYIYAGAIFQ